MAEPPLNNDDLTPPPPEKTRRKVITTWIVRVVKAGVAVGLLYLLLRTIRRDALQHALTTADYVWVLPAVALVAVNLALQGARWWVLAGSEIRHLSYGKAFSSFLGGISLGLITPGRVGEIGRVFLLQGASRLRLAGLHVLDKMYFVGLIGLAGPALLFFMPGFREALPEGLRSSAKIVVVLLPVIYFAIALQPKVLKSLLLAIQLAIGAKGRVLELLRAFDGLKARHCLVVTGLTLIQFLVILTQFFFLSRAFEPVAWPVAAHTYAASMFVKTALPISLGNLGVGEWAAVSFYIRYGIADTTGFSASLMLVAMNVLLPGFAGWVVLQRLKPAAILRKFRFDRGKAA